MSEEDKKTQQEQQELQEALHPDTIDWETFKVGEKDFEIRPMKFSWDQVWRKYALPIMGAELRPLESLIRSFVGEDKEQVGAGLTSAVVESELEVDNYLALAVGVICASQREPKATAKLEKTKHWAGIVADELDREKLRCIVNDQFTISKGIENLGKSLQTRLRYLGSLVGEKNLDFGSLLRDFKLPAVSSLAPTGPKTTTTPK
jgi:hypothetical protein